MLKKLNNKKGFSFIPTCVIIIVLVMAISILLSYAFVHHTAKVQVAAMQLKMDSYITKQAIENYDAFKQGMPYQNYIDKNELVRGAYQTAGFGSGSLTSLKETSLKEENEGKTIYTMARPTITAITGNEVGVKVAYELTIPFEAFGEKIADIRVPVEIVSKLSEK